MRTELPYVECQCGQRFQVLNPPETQWDAQATCQEALVHYRQCSEAANTDLVTAMEATFEANAW